MLDTLLVLASIAAVVLAAAAVPGPAFVALTRTAAASGRRAGIACAAGLAAGSMIWATAAMFGLAAVFAAAPWLATVLKVAGAGYLLWLAVKVLRAAGSETDETARPVTFRGALALQLSNPKPAVFFGSVFVAIIPAEASPALSAAIVALVGATDAVWFCLLALAFGAASVRDWFRAWRTWIDRVCGAAMAAMAVRLVGS